MAGRVANEDAYTQREEIAWEIQAYTRDNIKVDKKELGYEGCSILTAPRLLSVAGFCGYRNELLNSIKGGEFTDS